MITIKNLRKTLGRSETRRGFELVVDRLTLVTGELAYCVGPNGSGKTTLLSLVSGLLKPDSGEVLMELETGAVANLLTMDRSERARNVALVPQDADDALVNEMGIIDHVLVSLDKEGKVPWLFPRPRLKATVKDVVAQFDLGFEDRLDEPVGNLSSGERQVLGFCLAILGQPRLLLLDEFTGSLDTEMAAVARSLVAARVAGSDMCVIAVSHHHREAVENGDRILIMNRGKIHRDLRKNDSEFTEAGLNEIIRDLHGE